MTQKARQDNVPQNDPLQDQTSSESSLSGEAAGARNANLRQVLILVGVLALAVGVGWAGSQHGARAWGAPVFALAVAWIFLVQIVAFIPAWVMRTEKFYDLTGSLTYITTILAGLFLSDNFDISAVLIAVAVVMWAARLGPFLFRRVRKAGKDDRFDDIKQSFLRFLNVWMIQGLWVTITLSAALAAVTATRQPALNPLLIIGFLIWASGLTLEAVADTQKSRFRANPANGNEFIRTGVWSWSQHPNYFGEIILWAGVAVMALPALQGWQYVTLISPVFVIILLTKVSGIPLLERKGDAKWGHRADYREYKATTSILVPRPPVRKKTITEERSQK